MNPEECVFHEDPDLNRFLGSPEARLAYTRSFLIPFLQKFSAEDCGGMRSNLPERLANDTVEFVQTMARVKVASAGLSTEGFDAKRVLWEIHGGKVTPQKFLSKAGVNKNKAIPVEKGERTETRLE